MARFKDADVYTLEGKKIGRISEMNTDYFTAYNPGFITNEEFRIPVSAISAIENHDGSTVVRINLREEQLKHGFEFTREKPNSDFMQGVSESERKMPREKQVVHYETIQPTEKHALWTGDIPPPSEYLCDMCDEKFASPNDLRGHRVEQHRAATGI